MPTIIENKESPNNYNKRIEDLIEDAEIEAELEAERHIRIKNAKWMLISSVGLISLGILYFWTDSQPTAEAIQPVSAVAEMSQLPETPALKPIPFPVETPEKRPKEEVLIKTSDLEAQLEALANDNVKLPSKPIEKAKSNTKNETPLASILKKAKKLGVPLKEISVPGGISKPAKKESAPKVIIAKKKITSKSRPKLTSESANYSIQLAAFLVKNNAKTFVRKIQEKGIKPIIDVRQTNKKVYSVITGKFTNKDSGIQALKELKKSGFKPKLEEKATGQYSLIAGEFNTSKKAEKLRSKLTDKGFLSSISPLESQKTTYAVQYGAFSTRKQAKTAQTELSRLGIDKTFVKKIG